MFERIKTAIILLIIVGVAMFASREPFLILPLLLIGAGFGAFEWAKLMPDAATNLVTYQPPSQQIQVKPTTTVDYIYAVIIIAVLSVVLGLAFLPSFDVTVIWAGFWTLASLIWLAVIRWVGQYPNGTKVWYGKSLYVVGVVLLTATITAMYYLWTLSAWWLLYVFVLVWCADSGAYFVGRKLGKRKMSPYVSPNKSVEGLVGGVITGGLVVLGVSSVLLDDWSMMASGLLVGLSLVTIVMSVFGDLLESMLKRHAGVKDSGSLLPGHGGILDRIDSQLSAMPVFALGFWLMKSFGLVS